MPKSRTRKSEEISQIKDRFNQAKAVVFVNHQGLHVSEATVLRRTLRAGEVELSVIKRTLLRKALADTPHRSLDLEAFPGGLGLAFGYGDEVRPAKLLALFAKDHPALILVGGLIGERVLTQAEVMQLAKLPGQTELRAQVVSAIAAPLRGLVTTLAGPARGLVTALSALRDQRAGSTATS